MRPLNLEVERARSPSRGRQPSGQGQPGTARADAVRVQIGATRDGVAPWMLTVPCASKLKPSSFLAVGATSTNPLPWPLTAVRLLCVPGSDRSAPCRAGSGLPSNRGLLAATPIEFLYSHDSGEGRQSDARTAGTPAYRLAGERLTCWAVSR